MQECPDAFSERLFQGLAYFMALVFSWQLVIYFSFISDLIRLFLPNLFHSVLIIDHLKYL